MEFEDELRQLTVMIWESILRLPIEPAEPAPPAGTRTLTACVHVTGAWKGAVTVSCGMEMAAEAARIMFDQTGVPTTADMQDALGELANMVGGNLKALLPEPCQLSLPAVVEGADYTVRVPGSAQITGVPMRSGEHAISVGLFKDAVRKPWESGKPEYKGMKS